MKNRLSPTERAALAFAWLTILTTTVACGLFAGRVPENDPQPDDAERALGVVLTVFSDALGASPPVQSVTWIYEDQCDVGHPSIRWGGKCLAGLNLNCDIFVAVIAPISQSALAHEVAHCAGEDASHSNNHGPIDYASLTMQANNKLRTEGM